MDVLTLARPSSSSSSSTLKAPLTCPQCPYQTPHRGPLRRHLWRVHSVGQGRCFPCGEPLCTYQGKTSYDLTRHRWLCHHQGPEQWFHCPQPLCGYKSRQNQLKSHLWHVHNLGDGPRFSCPATLCGYQCKQRSDLQRHHRSVHTLEGQQRRKRKEERTYRYLLDQGLLIDRETRVDFQCALGPDRGQTCAKIDFIYQQPHLRTVFLVEVDEYSHSSEGYRLSCECRRMMDATTSLMMAQPEIEHWVWVRFNPDVFTVNGQRQRVPWDERLATLHQVLTQYRPSQALEIHYLYYAYRTTGTDRSSPWLLIWDHEDFPASLQRHCQARPSGYYQVTGS